MDRSEKQKLIGHYIAEVEESMSESDFQREFFESLSDQFHRTFSLSEKQFECLERMYERVTA